MLSDPTPTPIPFTIAGMEACPEQEALDGTLFVVAKTE